MESLLIKSDVSEALVVLAREVLPQIWGSGYRHIRIKTGPSPSFTNLPNEIQIEILKHLEWDEVLALRQCCRLLYSLSKEWHVWYNLFLKYRETTFAQPYFLPKPLEYCSSNDLESHVTNWWSVFGRTTGESIEVATYSFDQEAVPRLRGPLLPLPSRHYLYTARDGTIYYGDPCQPAMGMHVLVPSPFSGETFHVRTNVALDFHLARGPDVRTSSFLMAFRLAVTRQPDDDPGVVEIWEIASQLEQGVLTGYSTTLLQSITEDPCVDIRYCSIFAEHVAYVVYGHDDFVSIVNWTNIEKDRSLSRTVISGGRAVERLFLLPSKRILIMYTSSMCIWDWGRKCSTITSLEDPALQLEVDPEWMHPQSPLSLHPFITPYMFRDCTRFVVLAFQDYIFGVSIPTNPDADLATSVTVTRHADVPFQGGGEENRFFGYSKGVYFGNGAYHFITYRWSDDENSSCSYGTIDAPRSARFHPRSIHYDEGRCQIYVFRRYDGMACAVIGSNVDRFANKERAVSV
ncbi:hypothetical protein CC2G_000110 [Coprinopsis cinerea AmutBmut pab1-1]|nr:hypothetical protein CC2G_000110 [Coprinopsis cinerea AmutBmut pab1-1]